VLEGDLNDFTLPDVLRLLAFTTKTGRLTLHDGVRHGRVELFEGRVRDASADAARVPLARRVLGAGLIAGPDLLTIIDERSALPTDLELARSLVEAGAADAGVMAELLREQTIDAAFDLLRWSDGSFRFQADAAAAATAGVLELAYPVDDLLTETSRRLEQWAGLVQRTGDLEAVVTIARPDRGPGEAEDVSLPADGWGLLALVDGRRTVADLVAVSGQGEYRTRRTLGALLDERVVTVGEAEEAGPLERLLRDQTALAEREHALAGEAVDRGATGAPAPTSASTPPPTPVPAAASATAGEPPPAAEPASTTVAAPAGTAAAEEATPAASAPADVRPLRTKVRNDRLRTDPTVDEDLVNRLIEGVEGL
jgi:hypothetical protein